MLTWLRTCLSPSVYTTIQTKHGPTHYNCSPMRGLHRVHLKTTRAKQQLCLFFLTRSQNYLHAASRTAKSPSVASRKMPANHQQKPNPRRLKMDWLTGLLTLLSSSCQTPCVRPLALASQLLRKCTNRGVNVFFSRGSIKCATSALQIDGCLATADDTHSLGFSVNFGVAGSSGLQFSKGALVPGGCLFPANCRGLRPLHSSHESQRFHVSPYAVPYAICPPVMSMK